MHSSSSSLIVAAVLGCIARSCAFVFAPKQLMTKKVSIHDHGTILWLSNNDDDDAIDISITDNKMMGGGIRDKSFLEREIELISRLNPDHADNNAEYTDLQNQELVVSELWTI
eukprot:scaffold3422_cov87-Skeletonema_dohrnii-CCMP3373.AAC.1